MQKFKGTPGPWWVEDKEYVCVQFDCVGAFGSSRVDSYSIPKEEGYANAKLCAAAPELLDALQELLTIGDIHASSIERTHPLYDFESWKMKAESAIKKALGEDDENY